MSDILRDKLIAVTTDLAEAKEVIRNLTRKHESQETRSREYEKDCQDKSEWCFDDRENCLLMSPHRSRAQRPQSHIRENSQ